VIETLKIAKKDSQRTKKCVFNKKFIKIGQTFSICKELFETVRKFLGKSGRGQKGASQSRTGKKPEKPGKYRKKPGKTGKTRKIAEKQEKAGKRISKHQSM
jgi:hypothetical protein